MSDLSDANRVWRSLELVETKIRDLELCVTRIKSKVESLEETIDDLIVRAVTHDQYWAVKVIVLGGAKIALVAVAVGLIALVVRSYGGFGGLP